MNIDPKYLAKVRTDPDSGCWHWTGGKSQGYGVITLPGHKWQRGAHCVFFEAAFGISTKGRVVCHSCDTPSCVNPNHLFLGSHSANNRDMVAKGRNARGAMLPQTRLTAEQVKEIRASSENGPTLAARYGVTKSWISQLRKGRWRKDAEGSEPPSA